MLAHVAGLLTIAVSLAAPLLLAAVGELIVERSGVVNVGIEGMALGGAFAAFVASHGAASAPAGVAAAAVAGGLLAALSALLCVRLGADQVVVGTAVNILSLGVTGVLFRALLGGTSPHAPALALWRVPLLSRLPIIGPAFFDQNVLGYAGWLLVPLCALFLGRTTSGLRLRAVGEYPAAAEAAGARVGLVRTLALVWGGALAGLAGAFLSIGYTDGFTENMTAGRGFIALAVVILGRWNPAGIAVAALAFGVADALHYQLQATGTIARLPYQALQALPYVLTLVALLLRSRLRGGAPAGLGEAYRRA